MGEVTSQGLPKLVQPRVRLVLEWQGRATSGLPLEQMIEDLVPIPA